MHIKIRPIKKALCLLALTGAVTACYAQSDTTSDHYYLYTYFYNTEQESGPRLAVSTDGVTWGKVNKEQPIFTPTAGVDKLARDPNMWFDSATGVFHCVWTSGWVETGFGYATSKDLKTWSDQVQLPLGEKIPGCVCCWGPEIFYDDLKDSVMIYWSSEYGTIGKSTFYVMTKDFVTFTDPVKLFDPGYSHIDAAIVKYSQAKYYLFFKDERSAMDAGQVSKNIHYVYGPTPQGPWSNVSTPVTQVGTEGPSPIIIGDELRVYFDNYNNPKNPNRMVKVTADPSAITPSPWPAGDTMSLDGGSFNPGHGSVMEIRREYALFLVYGTVLPSFASITQSGAGRYSQRLTIARPGVSGVYDLLGRNVATIRTVDNTTLLRGRNNLPAPGVLFTRPTMHSTARSVLTVR